MGTVDAGRLFLEALTCAGERADLNAASNFDTTCAPVLAGTLAELALSIVSNSRAVEEVCYLRLDSALGRGRPHT